MAGRSPLAPETWPWADTRDPREWVLASAEPAARWVLLTGVLDRLRDDPVVVAEHQAVLADPGVRDLVARLPDWEAGEHVSGHDSPRFAPNLLNLLADMGVQRGDDAAVDHLLVRMLAHQDADGRFLSFAPPRRGQPPVWGSLLCDRHAILEVLVRYGYLDHPRVKTGLDRMAADLTVTAQGPAWPCQPDPASGFRGPGRKADFCPLVTLQALRVLAALPVAERPADVLAVARVSLAAWQRRRTQKPYQFGHGPVFATVKWPSMWYRVDAVLDTLARYPQLWSGPDARAEDRAAMVELTACLLANLAADGRVTPRSTYRGFESHSFGQKKRASPFATARVLSVLHRLDDLAADVEGVDAAELTGLVRGSV